MTSMEVDGRVFQSDEIEGTFRSRSRLRSRARQQVINNARRERSASGLFLSVESFSRIGTRCEELLGWLVVRSRHDRSDGHVSHGLGNTGTRRRNKVRHDHLTETKNVRMLVRLESVKRKAAVEDGVHESIVKIGLENLMVGDFSSSMTGLCNQRLLGTQLNLDLELIGNLSQLLLASIRRVIVEQGLEIGVVRFTGGEMSDFAGDYVSCHLLVVAVAADGHGSFGTIFEGLELTGDVTLLRRHGWSRGQDEVGIKKASGRDVEEAHGHVDQKKARSLLPACIIVHVCIVVRDCAQ
jgi:hypothetical protein